MLRWLTGDLNKEVKIAYGKLGIIWGHSVELCGCAMVYFSDVLCITEVFSQVPWLELRELQGPVLQELAGRLPNTKLHSRADSTTKKYLGAFRRWKSWASQPIYQCYQPRRIVSPAYRRDSAIQICSGGGM